MEDKGEPLLVSPSDGRQSFIIDRAAACYFGSMTLSKLQFTAI